MFTKIIISLFVLLNVVLAAPTLAQTSDFTFNESNITCHLQEPVRLNISLPPSTTGRVIAVTPQNIQSVLDDPSTQPGDVIQLHAGVEYPPLRLPAKAPVSPGQWIIIRSDSLDPTNNNFEKFSGAGQRVEKTLAPLMAKIVTPNDHPALETAPGAHHYWIEGLELATLPNFSSDQGSLVVLGDGAQPTAQADNIVLDRLYIHGQPNTQTRRGVTMNGANLAIINSIIDEIHTHTYQDASIPRYEAQAIALWNGPGPYQIKNNYLSASTQEILVGGSTSCSEAMVPSDIEISNNYFFKPLGWRVNAIPHWWVKNHLELKTGRRVLISDNFFENSWADSAGDQAGAALLFVPMNQVYSGLCDANISANPWSEVRDINFTNNIVYNAGQGISMTGEDTQKPSQQTSCVHIVNNLFYGSGNDSTLSPDTSPSGWGNGTLFTVVSGRNYGVRGLYIAHNTALQNGALLVADSAYNDGTLNNLKPFTNVVVESNIVNWQHQPTNRTSFRGIAGSGTPEGFGKNEQSQPNAAFTRYFPDIIFRQNIFRYATTDTGLYYTDHLSSSTLACLTPVSLRCNYFIDDIKFDNSQTHFTLVSSSPFATVALSAALGSNVSQDIGANGSKLEPAEMSKINKITTVFPPSPAVSSTSPIEESKLIEHSSLDSRAIPTMFARNLWFGLRGQDVRQLQHFLNAYGFYVAQRGAGSRGKETPFFGPLTRRALLKFQQSSLRDGEDFRPGILDVFTRSFIDSILSKKV